MIESARPYKGAVSRSLYQHRGQCSIRNIAYLAARVKAVGGSELRSAKDELLCRTFEPHAKRPTQGQVSCHHLTGRGPLGSSCLAKSVALVGGGSKRDQAYAERRLTHRLHVLLPWDADLCGTVHKTTGLWIPQSLPSLLAYNLRNM